MSAEFSIRQYRNSDPQFQLYLKDKAVTGVASTTDVEPIVRDIIDDVRKRGLAAVLDYTLRFDKVELSAQSIEIRADERKAALKFISKADREALKIAAKRIRAYQKKLVPKSWMQTRGDESLGQLIIPMDRVGVYVPGGKASYPSSVLDERHSGPTLPASRKSSW